MKNFEFCIFIGSFAPFHNGQYLLLQKALEESDKVIIVLGSHKKARNIRIPWNTSERIEMISSTLSDKDKSRISFIELKDNVYNNTLWIGELLKHVSPIINKSNKVALISWKKNQSDYVKLFPQWTPLAMPNDQPLHDAEDIRHRYFTYDTSFERFVHPNIVSFMKKFQETDNFKDLKKDFDYIKQYASLWMGSPFKPIFSTVDSVVMKSGHILVVRRKGFPGKNTIALPGGFLNQEEEIEDAALRELKEETSIKIQKEELRKHIVNVKVFSSPFRSLRGRTITHAHFIDLGVGLLPEVKGGSDSAKSWWMPINEILEQEDQFFEDHFDIIQSFINQGS